MAFEKIKEKKHAAVLMNSLANARFAPHRHNLKIGNPTVNERQVDFTRFKLTLTSLHLNASIEVKLDPVYGSFYPCACPAHHRVLYLLRHHLQHLSAASKAILATL